MVLILAPAMCAKGSAYVFVASDKVLQTWAALLVSLSAARASENSQVHAYPTTRQDQDPA